MPEFNDRRPVAPKKPKPGVLRVDTSAKQQHGIVRVTMDSEHSRSTQARARSAAKEHAMDGKPMMVSMGGSHSPRPGESTTTYNYHVNNPSALDMNTSGDKRPGTPRSRVDDYNANRDAVMSRRPVAPQRGTSQR